MMFAVGCAASFFCKSVQYPLWFNSSTFLSRLSLWMHSWHVNCPDNWRCWYMNCWNLCCWYSKLFVSGCVRKLRLVCFWWNNWEGGKNVYVLVEESRIVVVNWESWWGLVGGHLHIHAGISREKVVLSTWREACRTTNGSGLFGNRWMLFNIKPRGSDSSVCIATRYVLDGRGTEFRWRQDTPHPSWLALGPTQPYIQWVPGVMRLERGVNQPSLSRAEVEERVEMYLYSPSWPPWSVIGRTSHLFTTWPITELDILFWEFQLVFIINNDSFPESLLAE